MAHKLFQRHAYHHAASTLLLLGTLFSAQASLAGGNNDSAYTDLASEKCRTLKTEQDYGATTQQCPGIAGYRLLVEDFDGRQSITVVSPDGRQHPLNFSQTITNAFSTLGKKAEWRRGPNKQPLALIVRVYASENPDKPAQQTQYLSVSKIAGNTICVTDKIKNSATMNETARDAADSAANRACLK